MLNVSEGFLETLSSSHRVQVVVESRKGGQSLLTGIPLIEGQITVDTGATCRRTLSLTVPPRIPLRAARGDITDQSALPDTDPDHPLAAFGQELSVYYGLVYTDDSVEWLPVGVFRIEESSGGLAPTGEVSVSGRSREAWIIDARFVAPRTISSPSTTSAITELIKEVLPSVEVVVSCSRDARVPTVTYDSDRWGAITQLAEAIGAVVYTDGWGRFVIDDAPLTSGEPDWVLTAGPGGCLVSAGTSTSRDGVFNAVVVRGESPSGDFAPVQGVEYDEDPTSPTRWGDPAEGNFGMCPTFEEYPTVATLEQARSVARSLLAKYTGVSRTLEASSIPNPALEGGELLYVIPDPSVPAGGSTRVHLVDGFTLGLRAGDPFPIRTREVRGL